jgi:hypothetical protein
MSRWATLFEDWQDQAWHCLKESIEQGHNVPVPEASEEYHRTHPEEPEFVVYEHPDTPARILAICQTNPENDRLEVVAGFPFLLEGEPNIFEVLDVVPEDGGSQGTIECVSKCGDSFFFFEPLMCYHKDELKIGRQYEFAVAGIAYLLDHVANPEFVIDSGPALDAERQRALKENPEADISTITSVTFSTANLRSLIAREEPGDAQFQTAVESVTWFELAGTRVCKMRCMFRGGDEKELPCSLYASEYVLKGYEPKAGDNIQGVMWMQAHPLKEVASEESWIDRGSERDASMGGILRAIEAKEYFSDLPPGVAALGCALVGGGWDVTRYGKESDECDVPDFLAEARDRQVNVWVNAYFPESEQPTELSAETREMIRESSRKRRQEAIFTTVRCRMAGNYYYYEFVDKERLQEVFGEVAFIDAERIPGTQEPGESEREGPAM